MGNEAWMTFFTVLGLVVVAAIFVSALKFVNGMRKAGRRRAANAGERLPATAPRSDAAGADKPSAPGRRTTSG